MASNNLDRQIKSLVRKLHKIGKVEIPRAYAKALNNTGNIAKTEINKTVGKETRLGTKIVRNRTFLRRARAKKPLASVRLYVAPISAVSLLTKNQIANKLGTGTNKKGVKAKGYFYKSAFIQPGLHGKIHVFKRKSKARYPLKKQVVEIKPIFKRRAPQIVRSVFKARFSGKLKHELSFRLQKHLKKR